jgi:hypothetical protein
LSLSTTAAGGRLIPRSTSIASSGRSPERRCSDSSNRLRIEKAARALLNHPDQSVLVIALGSRIRIRRDLRASVQDAIRHERHRVAGGGAGDGAHAIVQSAMWGKQLRKAGKARGRARPHSGGRRTEER